MKNDRRVENGVEFIRNNNDDWYSFWVSFRIRKRLIVIVCPDLTHLQYMRYVLIPTKIPIGYLIRV